MLIPVAMWSPSIYELLVVLVLVLVLFGAGKLPSVFRSLGEGLKSFRDGQAGIDDATSTASKPPAIDTDPVREAEEIRKRVT